MKVRFWWRRPGKFRELSMIRTPTDSQPLQIRSRTQFSLSFTTSSRVRGRPELQSIENHNQKPIGSWHNWVQSGSSSSQQGNWSHRAYQLVRNSHSTKLEDCSRSIRESYWSCCRVSQRPTAAAEEISAARQAQKYQIRFWERWRMNSRRIYSSLSYIFH